MDEPRRKEGFVRPRLSEPRNLGLCCRSCLEVASFDLNLERGYTGWFGILLIFQFSLCYCDCLLIIIFIVGIIVVAVKIYGN